MTRIKVLSITAALSAATMIPISAQIGMFGAGLPVFDGTQFAEMIAQTAKLASQVKAAIDTYNKVTDQYNHMTYQARYIQNMVARYRSPTTLWKGLSATDRTGTNARWITAINGGADALAGWSRSVEEITTSGIILNNQQKREVATIELQDGAGVVALQMMGGIRSNGVRTEPIIASLENDSLSGNTDLNTVAAQQNKANAIAIIQAKQQADQNKLLVTANE